MAAYCTATSPSMLQARVLAPDASLQTSLHPHNQIKNLPLRSLTRRNSRASSARRQVMQKAASSQHNIEDAQANSFQSLEDTSLDGLRALPAEQRQALLFLAMSSSVLAASDVSQASDMQSLAALSVDRGQVISFLVNNPFVTLGVAVALYIIIPRILRFATKYVLLPASVAGVVYLVITNPSTSLDVASTGFKCEYAAAAASV